MAAGHPSQADCRRAVRGVLPPVGVVLAAVSGGPDSLALAAALAARDIPYVVAEQNRELVVSVLAVGAGLTADRHHEPDLRVRGAAAFEACRRWLVGYVGEETAARLGVPAPPCRALAADGLRHLRAAAAASPSRPPAPRPASRRAGGCIASCRRSTGPPSPRRRAN